MIIGEKKLSANGIKDTGLVAEFKKRYLWNDHLLNYLKYIINIKTDILWNLNKFKETKLIINNHDNIR